ncbi:transcript variant X2 [Nothobranchius furzeri]|uniref:Transcript variant X2 n=1 Tax=Nothobranchius furzeri TaxID=105023 RepID=A0A9D2XGN7_NOTFU|nr:transcript variant X2 [Nothobranchius furzeri]
MEEPGWIQMFLLLTMLLQLPGVVSGDLLYTIRAGDDIALSCENAIKGRRNCDTTTWIYSKPGRAARELVAHGQVRYSRSDPLSLAGNCSLVLRSISAEDAGLYFCRQYRREGGDLLLPDAPVYLFVVTLREQTEQNKVTFTCSVSLFDECRHEVKWLLKGNDVEKDHPDIKTSSPSSCSAAVTFQTSNYVYSSRFKLFKCEVETENKQQLFTFSSGPTGGKTDTTDSAGESGAADRDLLWLYIFVAPVLLALIITAVAFIRRRKGTQMQQNSNYNMSSDPAAPPPAETRQKKVEAEEGLSYASISYTQKPTRVKGEYDGSTVTYSTLKAAPAEPHSLYASIE